MLQASGAAPLVAQAREAPPNIVFLISDDHSAPGLGCYGNSAIQTPHLDRMAREGMRFNKCFVTSPQCSPNRSSIFTGCAPHTTSTSRLHTPMPDWEPSFLEPLKEKGYFVGAYRKVHQGAAFDKRWNYYGSAKASFDEFFDKRPADQPFFLHVGFTDPHRPYADGAIAKPHDPAQVTVPAHLPDTAAVRKDLAHYYDEISRMDSECGRVFDILRRRNLDRNTLVVFTGDNGMPFPRAKGACYDPGLNVPLLAWWQGRIAAGTVKEDLIAHVDLPVTWLEAAGIAKPAKMQGRSFLNLARGSGAYAPRTEICAERNWHDNFDPIRAVRTHRHKLIFNAAPHFPYRPAWDLEGSPTWKSYLEEARKGLLSEQHMRLLDPSRPILELYDLQADPNEFHNLAASPAHASVLAGMKMRLSKWMHDTLDFLPPGKTRPGEPGGREWPLSL
ncbi:MAG: sulfatase [Acidobacteriia bacterium]|nr:sulfatase [Terriglobia bacterium]